MLDINISEKEHNELKRHYLDVLEQSLEAFKDLLNIQFDIVAARKGTKYLINLVFLERNFVHFAGIEKLVDVALVATTPNIYNKLAKNDEESNKIKEQLVASKYFDEIVGRLYSIIYLHDNFKNAGNNKHYKFVSKIYGNYTSIEYDFIIKCDFEGDTYYYFLRYDETASNKTQCVIVSLFIDNLKDYAFGQAYLTLLEKNETNKVSNETTIIYKKELKSNR